MYVIEEAMTSQKLNDVIAFSVIRFKKSMPQILHLNALYTLAFVSLEKDVSCVSLYGFCVLVM